MMGVLMWGQANNWIGIILAKVAHSPGHTTSPLLVLQIDNRCVSFALYGRVEARQVICQKKEVLVCPLWTWSLSL